MNDILDEVTLGLCFEMHRSSKLGTLFLDEMDDESQKRYESVNVRGLDVFGQVPSSKKQYDCQCPNCHRSLAASRFAPHLEKCMGMGGNVVRVARRSRMPNVSKRSNNEDVESDDNSNDNDWTGSLNKKAKKLKKSGQQKKKSPRKMKSPMAELPVLSSPSSSHSSVYDGKPIDKQKILRNQMCGVISEHTKKICTRSMKCPQHTDEQRQQVRTMLYLDEKYAGKQSEEVKGMMTPPSRPFSTLDSMSHSHPSPADSCSTATSSSSRKRTKSWSKKSKKKKKKKSAPSLSPRLTSRHNIVKYVFDSSSSSSIMS